MVFDRWSGWLTRGWGVACVLLLLGCVRAGDEGYSAQRYLAASDLPLQLRMCGAGRAPQTWGVVIGVNEYLDEGISDLKGSVSDAWIIYHYLTNPSGGGIPKSHLRLLLNEEATRTEVEGAIGNFLAQSCPQDQVLIYFAGHGAPEPGREQEAFLLVHDTRLDNMVGSAISMRRLPDFLKWRTEEVGELLLVVDACHSGNIMFPNQRGIKKPPAAAARERAGGIDASLKSLGEGPQRWSVISAASADQLAGELRGSCGGSPEYTGGLFTCHLLQALKGLADLNADGALSTSEIFQHVRAQVSKETGGAQTPTFSGVEGSRPFFKAPKASGAIEIPRIPEVYVVREHRSVYSTPRWISLGLTAAAGVAGAMLNAQANDLTREATAFPYRSKTAEDYQSLLRERDSAVTEAKAGYVSAAALGVLTLSLAFLEWRDRPEQREDVYQREPWFSLPASSPQAPASAPTVESGR